jgi:Domain of unknown function (DUF4331)
MSDHFDAEDLRTDLTDIYVFPAPARDRSVLIMCANPEPAETDPMFDPAASYELKLDTDNDAVEDISFNVTFSIADGQATATVHRATGADARGTGEIGVVIVADAPVSTDERVQITDAGPYRFFVGARSDPHFKDILGFRNNFQFTGQDPVAARNVLGFALEVPNDAIGSGAPIHLWARTVAPVDGALVQVDQAGRPGVNNTFNPEDEDRAAFCRSSPADQVAAFGDRFLAYMRSLGYPEAEAAALLPTYLPDWLEYDPSRPVGYPNGRLLTDDTADLLAAFLTRGRITSDTVGPHTDLLAEFPFLGPPHAEAGPTV